MKKKSKRKFIILVLALISIIGLGSLFAYLSDTDQKTNVFTLGSIKITLTEPNWNPSSGQNILPGQPISKDPQINNVGNNPAYVYIKVVNPIVELNNGTTGVLFNYTAKSGWTQLDQIEQCGYRATTYYYNTALNASNSTTTLFDSITINDFSGYIEEDQLLDIYAYGIQSTYLQSGSTVTSIFTDAFTTSLFDTDEKCNSVLDCSENENLTTIPSNLKGLARIMAKNSYLDNGKSEYVTSCGGVSFSAISSDTNGKGIYELASTKDDTYPIYYYRGEVDNHVKFAGFCWKAIRTTDTGGVKLIYNGELDGNGNCTNTTGTAIHIGKSYFMSSNSSPSDVGYMYGTRYTYSSKTSSNLATAYVYGSDVTYSNGTYTLTNTMTTTGTWATDYNTLSNNHYTCFSTGTTCSSVYYIYYTSTANANYITLENGKKVEDALDEMFNENNINTTDSTIKTQIDNWYNTNLLNYTSYIEDTIYCNDRSISQLGGFNPDGGDTTKNLYFSPYTRTSETQVPNIECGRTLDSFTVSSSNGNGALTYPVGLITIDEVVYAGGRSYNGTYYLFNPNEYSETTWTLSPSLFASTSAREIYLGNGTIVTFNIYTLHAVRPVISLKSTDVVESGDGTATNPYVIRTS